MFNCIEVFCGGKIRVLKLPTLEMAGLDALCDKLKNYRNLVESHCSVENDDAHNRDVSTVILKVLNSNLNLKIVSVVNLSKTDPDKYFMEFSWPTNCNNLEEENWRDYFDIVHTIQRTTMV